MESQTFAAFIHKASWLQYGNLNIHLRIIAGLCALAAAVPVGQARRLLAGLNRMLLRRGYISEVEIVKLITVRKNDKEVDKEETEGRESLVREVMDRMASENRIMEIELVNVPIYLSNRFKNKLDKNIGKTAVSGRKSRADELLVPVKNLYPFDVKQMSEYLDTYCSTTVSLEFPDGIFYVGVGRDEIFFTCESCGLTYELKDNADRVGVFCSDLCEDTESRISAYENKSSSQEWSGLSAGIAQSAMSYSENVVMSGERGHGFAAEKANHLHDQLGWKSAELVGADNAKNGADRIVDGIRIQTKFCASGSRCIGECFENGTFRYMNPDGSPMLIEVPYDKYFGALDAMKSRISKGQIPGISDPERAKDLLKRSPYTYKQAENIARFGTFDSIKYDAMKGIQIAGSAMGISALITFVTAIWRGDKPEKALKAACYSGLKTGGVVWLSSITSAQLGRTSLEGSMRKATDRLVKKLSPKMTNAIANLGKSGAPLSGSAAANSASKLLRGNIVTALVTTAILSSADVARMVRGKMSGAQLFKNITTTTAGVAGGTAGWMAGAAAGAAIGSAVPIIGTVVGGFIGGLIGSAAGGSAATAATKGVLGAFIEDDAKKMYEILEKQLSRLTLDFMLTAREVDRIVTELKDVDINKELRNMYASKRKRAYANYILKPIVVSVVSRRELVVLPSDEQIIEGVYKILEEAA